MELTRKLEILAGCLFLIGTLTGILSVSQAIDHKDFMIEAWHHKQQVILAGLFQLLMSLFYGAFVILLYLLLKRWNEGLGLGFLSLRLAGLLVNVFAIVCMFMILYLSQRYVGLEKSDASIYLQLGNTLKYTRDLLNHVIMMFLHISAGILLYSALLHYEILPKWMALFGIMAASLAGVASLLVLFSSIQVISSVYLALTLPLALQELLFAFWLIIKGFNW